MIVDICQGDITDKRNKRDIIIGMNTKCAEASAIGRRVLIGKGLSRPLELGDVVTFGFDANRRLHMLICHHLCTGGWMNADKYIRFGLDYLWQRDKTGRQDFSIVKIGTGPVGRRDGADSAAILTAMADSFARLRLFVWDNELIEVGAAKFPPLRALRTWSLDRGEREIRLAA